MRTALTKSGSISSFAAGGDSSSSLLLADGKLKGARVLLADDLEITRRGMARLLRGSGITLIDEVGNGEHVVERCHEVPYDVIVMEAHMPALDAVATTHHIRQLERLKGVKKPVAIYVMVASEDRATAVDVAKAGAKVFLKPFRGSHVAEVCDNLYESQTPQNIIF